MGISVETLAAAKKYTKESIEGITGSLAGKNATIDSITDITGGHRVTFKWTADNGDVRTQTMDVMDGADGQDGEDGKGIKSVAVNSSNHLIITYDDDTTVDAGEIDIHSAVNSVNGKTGNVNLTASDVGALPDDTSIPSKTSDLTNDSIVDSASYDSTNHQILFKNGTTTLFSLDAAAFVKDGMVDDVEISGGNLVITFNTDAGKQAISIPLTDIFDPANYYDKDDVDGLLADKANESDVDDIAQSLIDYEVVDVKNILDPKWFNNASGCTVTTFYDKDKVTKYVLTGTTTGGNGIQFARRVAKDLTLPVGESYVFSVSATLPFGVLEVGYTHPTTGAWTVVKSQATDVLEFTVPAEADGMPWTIQYVPGGSDRTFDNLSIYPMLCTDEEWAKSHNYEPFYIPVKDAMFRRSEQGVLGAKNLLENNSLSETINGITFTLNSDGSVTAQGTPTGITRYSFTRQISNEMNKLPSDLIGKSVIVSGGYTQNNGTLEISCITRNSSGQDITDHAPANGAKERQFTIESNAAYIRIYAIFDRNGNHTPVNVTMKPMLRLASDPDDTYVPYTPTNAKLNEEKMSYADNGVLGAKNLLEIIASTTTINGITFTINADKSVTVNGTATANTNFRLIPYANIDLSLWTGKPLRLSGCPSGGSNPTYAMEIYYNDGEQHWVRDFGDGAELSIPISGLTSLNPNIMIKNGVTVNNLVFKPMVRLASDPDDTYQSYAMTNKELTEKVNVLPREIFVTTDTRTTTTSDANTLPCGFTRMNDENSNLPTDGTGGSAVWYDILTVRQSNDPSKTTWGYGFQLAVQTTTNANMGDTYVRAVNGGDTPAWSAWKKLN